jgi:hypothetical protein
MRVYDQNLKGAAAAQTGNAQEVHGAGRSGNSARTHGSNSEGDRIEFSHTMSAVSRALAAHETERAAHVQKLAAQYAKGEYHTDSAATSRAMVSDSVASAAH